MSIKLTRNVQHDLYKDYEGRYRTVFNVCAATILEKLSVLDFMREFEKAVDNMDACYFSENVDELHIMVGYSQKFENEFKAKFER